MGDGDNEQQIIMEEEGGEQDIVLQEELVAAVTSVNGKTGDVVLKTSDLENDSNYQNGSQVNSAIAVHNTSATAHADIRQTLAGKQEQLSADQLNAVNSGIDQSKVAQISTNAGNISTINGKIPTQASTDNQLADKNFVNSSVQTATANFRGSWSSWTAVPSNADDYPVDYAGSKTPTVNDYLVIQDASDYPVSPALEGTWRFKYSGTWSVNGKSGWNPEYQVNETPMTAAQLAALNSNITAELTEKLQGIEAGAQVNKIEGIKVNGLDQTPDANKKVDIAVPVVPDDFFTKSATVSGSGTSTTLANTGTAKFKDISLKGDTFQQTYEGKNLFNYTSVVNLANGNTILESSAYRGYYIPTIPGTTYVLSRANTTGNNRFRVSFTIDEPAQGVTFYNVDGSQGYALVADDLTEVTFTVPANMNYVFVYLSNADETITESLKIQLELGSTATTYEPYVGGIPAPNPDYPQDINVVTGEQTVKIMGKNLWGGFTGAVNNTILGISFVNNADGTISILSGTATGSGSAYSMGSSQASSNGRIMTLPAGTYTISGATSQAEISVINAVGTQIATAKHNIPAVLTLENETRLFLRTTIRKVSTGDNVSAETVYPMLERSSTASSYEPYQAQTYPLSLGSLELCEIGDYRDAIFKNTPNSPLYDNTLVEGGWYKRAEVTKKILDGSENWERATFSGGGYVMYADDISGYARAGNTPVSNFFTGKPNVSSTSGLVDNCATFNNDLGVNRLYVVYSALFTTVTEFKTWLSTHNTTVYYALATPTNTQITDATLVAQLEALYNARTLSGITNISSASVLPNLPAILAVDAFCNGFYGIIGGMQNEINMLEYRVEALETEVGGVSDALDIINNGGGT